MQAMKTNPMPAPRFQPEPKEIVVHVRLCKRLAKGMDLIVWRDRTSRSDFLRDAIEEKIKRETD